MNTAKLLDESVLGPAFLRQAWGELSDTHYPWITATWSVSRLAHVCAWELGLAVEIRDHRHSDYLVSFHLEGIRAKATVCLSDRDMMLDATGQLVWGAFETIIERLSPRIYEHDPRIGSPPHHLKTCRLFDPVTVPRPAYYQTMNQPAEVPCSLCGKVFEDGDPAMWGGGNVLWVHYTCWCD